MGGRRLPRAQTVIPGLLLLLGSGLASGCTSDEGSASASDTPATPAETATTNPVATATPDILGSPPTTRSEARAGVESALKAEPATFCPERLEALWRVACALGDLDGDRQNDQAFLVPLSPRSAPIPNSAVVFVRFTRGTPLEEFPGPSAAADASAGGRGVFGIADRTGDGKPEFTLLANECGARACSSRLQIMSWDGTAWRDIGPNPGVDNLDSPILFEGSGTQAVITMHGGKLTGAGAGPSRASTYTYALLNGRFELKGTKPDAPTYLFHAIQDADALFDAGDFTGATAAYKTAIENPALKDWRKENGEPEGRPALEAYALFRIAVATAATGADPAPAIDRTIQLSKEPLFTLAVEAFRRGYQERRAVQAGCVAATTYFNTVSAESDVPAYIRAMFSYGYANFPVKGPKDLCPL